jgi:guanine nucleotide exchange protein RalF
MHPNIEEAQREIVELFNEKPKKGIDIINKICEKQGINPEEQIAKFFYAQKKI